MARSKSSSKWLKEHFEDEYVLKAQKEGYRSRAVYKLKEIQAKDRMIKAGMSVIDLGAAPGGWSQYTAEVVGKKGRVIALDILEIEAIDGVDVICGDFRENDVLQMLMKTLQGSKADLVFSDMAPNISGMKVVDIPRAMYLAEITLDLANKVLKTGGCMLVKVFQGEGFDQYLVEVKQKFERVVTRKPRASRPRSREIYTLASGFEL